VLLGEEAGAVPAAHEAMTDFTTPAILLRRTDYGDYDRILTCFTLSQGKIAAIAKYARKSQKRFAGVLELFTELRVVCSRRRAGGLAVLKEASLVRPYAAIRSNVARMAYASFWAEMVNLWMEDGQAQATVFRLLQYALCELDAGRLSAEKLSLIFQVRFLAAAGLCPDFRHCSRCKKNIADLKSADFSFNIARAELLCAQCRVSSAAQWVLSRKTIMQLLWIAETDLAAAGRIRLSPDAQAQALGLFESFVPYHLGRAPHSLKFLKQMRRRVNAP